MSGIDGEIRTDFDTRFAIQIEQALREVPDEERERARHGFGDVREKIHGLIQKKRSIERSIELTTAGKTRAQARLSDDIDRAIGALHTIELRVEDYESEIASAESAALGGLTRAPGGVGFIRSREEEQEPRTVEQVARQREIRDRLHLEPRLRVKEMYLEAAYTGDDPELVAAIEQAPRSFPLVDDATRQQVRDWRIDNSPFAPRIRMLRQLHETYSLLLASARQELEAIRR